MAESGAIQWPRNKDGTIEKKIGKQGLIIRDGFNRMAIAYRDKVGSTNTQNKFQLARDMKRGQKGSWMHSREGEKEGYVHHQAREESMWQKSWLYLYKGRYMASRQLQNTC